jgi:hypothetical protein
MAIAKRRKAEDTEDVFVGRADKRRRWTRTSRRMMALEGREGTRWVVAPSQLG